MSNKLINYVVIILLIIIFSLATYIIFNSKDITFTINENKIILKVNEIHKIDYEISNPNINITWNSSNPSAVEIDNNGNIISKNIGRSIITGSINTNNIIKEVMCFVTVKASNYDIALEDIILPNGEILISTGEVYPIPFTFVPNDGYADNIDYVIENTNIISVEDGFIKGLNTGSTLLTIVANSIRKEITVNVINKQVPNNLIIPVNNISFDTIENSIYINEEKTLSYLIEPNNATIYDTKWESSDENILTIDEEGKIKGLSSGTATIQLTINDKLKQSIDFTVKSKITNIDFNYSIKKILKVGETVKLEPTINNNWLTYESNNPNCLSVNNGTLTAKSRGSAIIAVKNDDGTIKKSLYFVVYDKIGVVNNDQTIWAFNKDTDVIPRRADTQFFANLARKGKGTFSNNIYTISNYSYDVNSNLLTIGKNNKIFMRMYYPQGKDLSTQNTFTFIGGIGEGGFGGYFADIEANPSLIKNSGIIILVPEHNSAKLTSQNIVSATNFVKLIISQNSKARNIIGGYSNGGPIAGEVAAKSNYDKIMLINTSFYWVNTKTNLKNTEIVIYSARNDSWHGTNGFIGELYDNGFKNVTVISNNESIIERYKSKYLVINPGNSMKNGHTSENLTLSHFFSYACD